MFTLHLNDQTNIDQLLTEKSASTYSEDENYIISFIEQWISGKQAFDFYTSGSTGTPKRITLYRNQLEYSARCTLDFLQVKSGTILLSLSPQTIAGSMQIVRALTGKLSLSYHPPSRSLHFPTHASFCLVSLVPLQVQNMLKEDPTFFDKIDNLLIGGAPLALSVENQLSQIHTRSFITFGMTETASHIALRSLNSSLFKTLGDVKISTYSEGLLQIQGTVTNNKIVQTHDLVDIISSHEFKWLGRSDFAINSGGIKVLPEQIEGKLEIEGPFMITSTADNEFGEVVTLLVSHPIKDSEKVFANLSAYQKPRKIIQFDDFAFTESGKINRLETTQRYKKYLLNK